MIDTQNNKVKDVFFSTFNEIIFTKTCDQIDDIKVLEDEIEVFIKLEIHNNIGTIKLQKKIDITKYYQLKVDGKINQISYLKLYDTKEFEEAFYYDGDDLGSIVNKNKTTFRIWAPISNKVILNIYESGDNRQDTKPIHRYEMKKDIKGTWYFEINQSLHSMYYTYSITNYNKTNEVIDPYAKSAGVNGIRGMIVDFKYLNPKGFKYLNRPKNILHPTDAIIYELHVRDLTSDINWNGPKEYRGKFLGISFQGTKYNNYSTGFDHIKELGITHIQLMPIADFIDVDETKLYDENYNSFNWGYMPLNYNVPKGSYSTNPYDGCIRVKELKQMISTLTENNIAVIMDVVYNHTAYSENSNFNLIVPSYYHRITNEGIFSNGSGTGNEIASSRKMVRKMIVESILFWAKEYNISGFRFDLMALLDTDTMEEIRKRLKEIDKNILIYGEPWMGGVSLLESNKSCDKLNLKTIPEVGAFNDDFRDGVRGSVFNAQEGGFVQGNREKHIINKVKYGIVGGTYHPNIDHQGLSYNQPWHIQPIKTINYLSSHDNHTLHDKLKLSSNLNNKELALMDIQANAILLTSEGIPFIHAGEEFLRSKKTSDDSYDHNSYRSPDGVNQLKWKLKEENFEVFKHYQQLIKIRKNHPAFRIVKGEEITTSLKFIFLEIPDIIAYTLSNDHDTWKTIIVIHNSLEEKDLTLPIGSWKLGYSINNSNLYKIEDNHYKIKIKKHDTAILYQE